MGLLISLITQPWTMIFVVVLILAGAAYFYLRGAPAFIKLVSDWKVWLAIVAACFLIGSANLNQKVEDLQEEVKVEQVEADAYADAADVLTDRATNIRTRAAENQRITTAIVEATPGEEVDAVMDAIAAEDQRRADADSGAGA